MWMSTGAAACTMDYSCGAEGVSILVGAEWVRLYS